MGVKCSFKVNRQKIHLSPHICIALTLFASSIVWQVANARMRDTKSIKSGRAIFIRICESANLRTNWLFETRRRENACVVRQRVWPASNWQTRRMINWKVGLIVRHKISINFHPFRIGFAYAHTHTYTSYSLACYKDKW